ncbi:hypothetical protein E4T48_08364 [Aureobasidium sp. EXF-10727]|nr:hypothetical protein E4T48_08364 [Aureobasidium sp. EXF-10727]
MPSFAALGNAAVRPSILTNMTSGIELEVLAYAPEGIDPRRHLANALRKPVLLECKYCNKLHPWKLPFVGNLDRKKFVKGFSYAGWKITRDQSVRAEQDERKHVPKNSNFFAMEIVSRVLNFTKPTPCPLGQRYPCTGEPFAWDSRSEIFSMMQRTHEAFSNHGFCLTTNKTTGLHIHFGNGKEQPPVKTSLGMFGVFVATERLFDQILCCSRIPIVRADFHPKSGISRPHAVYKYDQGAKQNHYAGSISKVFLEQIRSYVEVITSPNWHGSPQEHHNTITALLREANVPFWLNKLSRFDDVQSFLETIPNTIDHGFWCPRYLAISLDNLGSKKGKNTVEVGINSGSTDPSEVFASYDFLGNLMLWLSTPDIDHNTVILDIWRNSESTILDLVKQVGASQSTIDYYTDRLTSDWAARRHSRLISSIDRNDPFKVFKIAIEDNRLGDSRREAVDDKIQQKLEDGHYGQIPGSLFKTLPAEIQNHPDGHILNMDGCDYEGWADKAIADAEVVYARRLAERSKRLEHVDKKSSDQDDWSSLYFF